MNDLKALFPNDYEFVVEPADYGRIKLCVVMPEELLRSFLMMLSCLTDMFKFLNYRNKINNAQLKAIDPNEIRKKQEWRQRCDDEIMKIFTTFILDYSVKESVSLTLRKIKPLQPNTSYDYIKNLVTKAGYYRKIKEEL